MIHAEKPFFAALSLKVCCLANMLDTFFIVIISTISMHGMDKVWLRLGNCDTVIRLKRSWFNINNVDSTGPREDVQ